ncbi:unnamed protein product [Kluyveromyces dobzhanskii CBS 2104]|uniref:WGS project CCBQ000000000 data, contig 00099 n=1 Tax=Kluyveromyces dobzhanskii CBS 2104 TaxID=1427455 RepID=A0A0A8L2R4_9SACH|nr:unnamed protein product [Kluyveromyces dobzhanskii CBS 2104]
MSGIFGSLDSSLDPEQINVQINNLDSYSCFPTILDTKASKSLPGIPFAQVPVLRFYGCLSTGHKVLIHCHGILPYIFIKYDGQMNESASAMRNRCSKLHNILETRMVVTYTKEEVKDKLKVLKYVANVSVVKGIPFYGYHVGYELYYKITLLNDAYCNKLSELLRDGKVFTSKTDAFEAHIPYILQMMADYNLFGCSWLKLSRCYFRQPFLLTDLDMNEILHTDSLKEFLEKQLKRNENVLDEDPFHRVGKTFLEIDILPQFIMNREEIQFRDLHHDFIELKSELQASDQGYVNSTKDIWKEIEAIRKTKHLKKYEGLREVFRESQMQYNWQEDERLVKYFDEAKVRTSSIFPKENLNFDTFVETSNNGHLIMKCREAIKELWPKIPRHVSRKVCLWSEMVPSTNKENIFNKRESKDLATTSNIPALMNLSFEEAKTSSGSSKRKNSSDFDQTSHETNRRKVFKLRKATISKSAYPAIKKPSITYENMKERLAMNQIDEVQYNEPFFSNPLDCKKLQTEIAGSLFKLSSNHISFRKALSHNSKTPVLPESEEVYQRIRWKYIKPKPSFQKVANFTESFRERFSMVAGKTPDLTYGYKFKSNKMHLKKNNAFNRMTHFTMELHVNTKEGMFPDPKSDSVRMIFWKIQDGTFPFDLDITQEGVLVFLEDVSQEISWKTADPSLHVTPYYDELEMIYALEDLVRFFDPDILSGYEIHSSSWGYLIDRCHSAHKYDVEEELSRVDNVQSKKKGINGDIRMQPPFLLQEGKC